MKRCVMLTRPRGFNTALAGLLGKSGIHSIERPMLEIERIEPDNAARQLAMSLADFDKVVFVSKNAVAYGIPLLEQYWPQWPRLQWFAVGRSTAESLDRFDIRAAYPPGETSEDLLDMPEFTQVAGESVLIVRGQGGREKLSEILSDRGARVRYLEVYRRVRVDYRDFPGGLTGDEKVDVVVVTSAEGLHALADSLPPRELAKLRYVVPSERVATIARELGGLQIQVAGHADDASLLQACLRSFMLIEPQQAGRG